MTYRLLSFVHRIVFWTVIMTSFFCLALISGFCWITNQRPVLLADKCSFIGVLVGLPLAYYLAQLVFSTAVVCTFISVVAAMMLVTCLYVLGLAAGDD